MLQQFTWQQFLIAAWVITIVWYGGVFLLFYRKEFRAFLSGRSNLNRKPEPLHHRWEKDTETVADENEESLVGEHRLPEGMSTVSTSGFGFAVGEEDKEVQVGLVPDVLEEVKSVFRMLAEQEGNKPEFFGMMKLVSEKFPKIGSNPNIGYINEFITDHAPFYLSPEEVESIWS